MSWAQSPSDLATAESLFTEGRKLMEEKKYDEACPKLEESYRIDEAQGTLLNLAVCHEEQGKIATAWGEFKVAYSLARKSNQTERIAFAKEHIDALEPRIPKVRINVPKEAQVKGLAITRNGSEVQQGGWGVPIAVDPGELVIEAKAPGYEPFQRKMNIAEKQAATIDIPVLKKAPKAAPEVAPKGEPKREPEKVTKEASTDDASLATWGWIAGGVGVVGLGVGTFFGLDALGKTDDYDKSCPKPDSGPRICTAEDEKLYNDANDSALYSSIGFGVGGALLVTGIVLILLDGGDDDASADSGVGFAVGVGRKSAGATLTGSF